MELILPREERGYEPSRLDEVARLPIRSVAEELVSMLGAKRVAVIGDVKETRRVREWVSGVHEPQRPEALRTALQAARLIADADDAAVARAWFSGCNQHLNFEAPMVLLQRGDPATYTRVVMAAFEFAHR
jgi:hypothetical protein